MSLTLTLSSTACKTAYKEFGTALNNEIRGNLEQLSRNEGTVVPKELIDLLERSLVNMLEKVGKKKTTGKKDRGIHSRFKHNGNDIKGKNDAFLRIRVDRETRIISKINETNWSDKAYLIYSQKYGTSIAYSIPTGSGKKSQIVAIQPYKEPLEDLKEEPMKKKKKKKSKKDKKDKKSKKDKKDKKSKKDKNPKKDIEILKAV